MAETENTAAAESSASQPAETGQTDTGTASVQPAAVEESAASTPVSGAAAGTAAADTSDSVYTVDDLAAAAKKVFGTRPECVRVALREANVKTSTLTQAKEIVTKFLKQEVK